MGSLFVIFGKALMYNFGILLAVLYMSLGLVNSRIVCHFRNLMNLSGSHCFIVRPSGSFLASVLSYQTKGGLQLTKRLEQMEREETETGRTRATTRAV